MSRPAEGGRREPSPSCSLCSPSPSTAIPSYLFSSPSWFPSAQPPIGTQLVSGPGQGPRPVPMMLVHGARQRQAPTRKRRERAGPCDLVSWWGGPAMMGERVRASGALGLAKNNGARGPARALPLVQAAPSQDPAGNGRVGMPRPGSGSEEQEAQVGREGEQAVIPATGAPPPVHQSLFLFRPWPGAYVMPRGLPARGPCKPFGWCRSRGSWTGGWKVRRRVGRRREARRAGPVSRQSL